MEKRTIFISGELADWGEWPGLKTVCMIRREVSNRTPKSHSTETAYLISSLDYNDHRAEFFLRKNRGHWGIENRLHYVRDVTMGEDACRVRMGSAPQVLAGIRNAVLNLLRLDGWQNIAAALRHHSVKVHKAFKLIGITEN